MLCSSRSFLAVAQSMLLSSPSLAVAQSMSPQGRGGFSMQGRCGSSRCSSAVDALSIGLARGLYSCLSVAPICTDRLGSTACLGGAWGGWGWCALKTTLQRTSWSRSAIYFPTGSHRTRAFRVCESHVGERLFQCAVGQEGSIQYWRFPTQR